MPCHSKHRRKRRANRSPLANTNRLIFDSTKAVIGLGVLGATANVASELLKK